MIQTEEPSARRAFQPIEHGGGCGGTVVFPKDPGALIKDGICTKCNRIVHKKCGGTIVKSEKGRECNQCRRYETYAIGQYFVVGQPGVSKEKLEKLCAELKLQITKVFADASRPELVAVLVAVSEADAVLNPQLLKRIGERLIAEKEIIRYLFDKPVAYNRFGEPTQYIE